MINNIFHIRTYQITRVDGDDDDDDMYGARPAPDDNSKNTKLYIKIILTSETEPKVIVLLFVAVERIEKSVNNTSEREIKISTQGTGLNANRDQNVTFIYKLFATFLSSLYP